MAIPKLRSDIIIGAAALVVSAASLITIIRHAVIMEKMLAAETLPYLEMETGNVTHEFENAIYFELRNSGVGPARIEAFQLFYDNKPISSWYAILGKCCGVDSGKFGSRKEFESAVGFLVTASAAPIMLPENARRNLVRYERDKANPSIYKSFDEMRHLVSTAACYCSVFDDCWVTNFEDFQPTPVKSCDGVNLAANSNE